MLLLSKQHIQKILTIKDTITILESAFAEFANGNVDLPERAYIHSKENNGMTLIMPGYLKESHALGTKIVSVYNENKKYNLPSVIGTIILQNDKTGEPLAIMDGTLITAFRTGAVAGLAVKYLARQNAEVHTLFGTGGMATPHALAMNEVRNIKKLNVVSASSKESKIDFVNLLKEKINCEIVICENAEEAIKEADIITLITSAKEPVINGDWIKPGTHIHSAGAHAPDMREIDTATIIKSKCVCDSLPACQKEAGDFIIPIEEKKWSWNKMHGTLGQIITKEIPARENETEITIFKSVGLAIQDLSTANYVYKKAVELGIGTEFYL
ncbi:MAG: ornithine cyclodeaminase family protein [Melioribacteraceae bacterium]|nr:MAG: ornithine cyclodeaminase family protein [Melioribacteraceae bacterium]